MKIIKIHIITQGCKVNLLDSEILMDNLTKNGFCLTKNIDEADVVIINSCTVTAKADRKFLQMARRIKKNNSQTLLCGIGCYTELNKNNLKKDAMFDIVLGSTDKFEITDLIINQFKANKEPLALKEKEELENKFYDYESINFTKHTRAFLKIQDGCNNYCSYCTIPYARGKSRSRNPMSIIKDVKYLAARGYQEIVLSGICLGDYHFKLKDKEFNLAAILKEILEVAGFRLRLGSIEPWCFTPELIDLVLKNKRICPHLHLPLQVASDRLIKAMNRNYTLDFYSNLVQKLKKRTGLHLSSDLIVGFPGESNEDFSEGLEYLNKSVINSLHVFSYSDRPLARASKFKEKVAQSVIKRRSKELRDLATLKKLNFLKEQVGRKLSVLVENINQERHEASGYSENYLSVVFSFPEKMKILKGNVYYCQTENIFINDEELSDSLNISFDDDLKIYGKVVLS